ncbi:MAG TPA: TRAP transporter small permease [Arenibaculum sp.]|nr:TRAP transporter small permease [Arenibaculum sp.]
MAESGSTRGLPERVVAALAGINRVIAIFGGIVLLATVCLILLDIVLRRTAAGSLGGADEISGYVMAGVATWGFSYALVERAHVRIDILQVRLPTVGRALLDILALASLCAVAILVAVHASDVLTKTLARGSRANTPLETPLWIPQSIWFAGWAWLALVSAILLACVIALALRRDWPAIGGMAGTMAGDGTEAGEKT